MSNSSKLAFSYRCIDFRKKRTFLRKPHFWLILALWLPFCEKGGYGRFCETLASFGHDPPLELRSGGYDESGGFGRSPLLRWPIPMARPTPQILAGPSEPVLEGALLAILDPPQPSDLAQRGGPPQVWRPCRRVTFSGIWLNFWSETRNFVKIALFALFGTPPKKVKKRSKKVQK